MKILAAFSPFIAFVVVERFAGPTAGLIAGAMVSCGLLLRELFRPGGSLKVLEVGTAILFGGLALLAALGGESQSVIAVRLRVDAGLLLIALASIALRRPFTLQYAREGVPPEMWSHPAFIRVNYILSAVWAAAFAVIVAAEWAMTRLPDSAQRYGITVIVLALVGAFKLTSWYPKQRREQARPPAST